MIYSFGSERVKYSINRDLCILIENIMVKGENAGYLYFLLFRQCFQRPWRSFKFVLTRDFAAESSDFIFHQRTKSLYWPELKSIADIAK